MGQKVHPKGFRLGTVRTWDSRWFSRKQFPRLLREDTRIREFLLRTLREAGVAGVDIERSGNAVTIVIRSAKPGFIIGRAGAGAEELKRKINERFFKGTTTNLQVNIVEVPRASLSAPIVAEQAAMDIEKRLPARRIMKQVIDRVQKSGAQGVKITLAGRLGGAEISRHETLLWGKIPLHNLRADIDYANAVAHTIYGTIGVKVWIYRGEVFEKEKEGSPSGDRPTT
ncbi:30S ribosomal protein S3 [Candidatus Uhrbacteria bacterium]|nr:30S ribosomal protein S3 [Candidatus Uhrbacteria bacterium]